MFRKCSFEELDLSNFKTPKVSNMSQMFSGCSSLKKLDLSNFVLKISCTMEKIFEGCNELEDLKFPAFGRKILTKKKIRPKMK